MHLIIQLHLKDFDEQFLSAFAATSGEDFENFSKADGDDKEVIEKCLESCTIYDISARDQRREVHLCVPQFAVYS